MDLAVDSRNDLVRRPVAERLAGFGLQPVRNIAIRQATLAARRAGQVVVERGELRAVYGRWWPYLGNHLRTALDRHFRSLASDRCELFYHTPLSSPMFLTLSYIHSGARTTLSTLYAATLVLDEIARLKGSLAIVCNVTNERITDRLLARWGWEAHCPHWNGRHFVKRFYGNYPSVTEFWRTRLGL